MDVSEAESDQAEALGEIRKLAVTILNSDSVISGRFLGKSNV
jgi:hypothetical protein